MKATALWKSIACALAGLRLVLRSERNLKIELTIAIATVVLGLFLRIGWTDWSVIVLTIGTVLAAEIGNTAVETVVDLVSPAENELARLAKDASAAAVLVTAMTSVVVGLLILGPPLSQKLISLIGPVGVQ